MFRFDIVTLFPEMFDAVRQCGISRIAIEKGQMTLDCHNPREFAEDRYRTVDDRPYGGGPGMVMKPEPLARCIDEVKRANDGLVVYLSPQGELLDQNMVLELSRERQLILLSGRYEGVDERLIAARVDREVSIGDYVLAGGELASMVLVETIARLLPGVLGNELSPEQDSFSNGLLDYPSFTRPEKFEGMQVPEVLLSGHHEEIQRWRLKQSLERTAQRRPDLLAERALSKEEQKLLKQFNLEQLKDE